MSLPLETPHTRKHFYVGGSYTTNKTKTHVFSRQMYVEHLIPASGVTKPYPLVFIPGQGQTGTNFLTKPDGRPGWSSFFLSHGYELYIVDQPSRGRSPHTNTDAPLVCFDAETMQSRFTAPAKYASYSQGSLHTQWPGEGTMGDPVFDAFYASCVPFVGDPVIAQSAMQAAGAALLDRIAQKVVLLGHSQGGAMPWLIADARPQYVVQIVGLEPLGPPFVEPGIKDRVPARAWGITDAPMTYEPTVTDPSVQLVKAVVKESDTEPGQELCMIQAESPAPRRLVKLKDVKVLVVTAEASWHSGYDWCTVRFLRQAGVSAEHVYLKDVGIRGNGHMFFLESNSDEIAEVVRTWIEANL